MGKFALMLKNEQRAADKMAAQGVTYTSAPSTPSATVTRTNHKLTLDENKYNSNSVTLSEPSPPTVPNYDKLTFNEQRQSKASKTDEVWYPTRENVQSYLQDTTGKHPILRCL